MQKGIKDKPSKMVKKVEQNMEGTKKAAKKSMPAAPKSNRKKMVEDDGF